MIFVTVGTHEQPFNRLVKYMDEWAQRRNEEVVIQTGFSTYEPKKAKWKKLYPYNVMLENVDEARIVITHGGPSSFIIPLQMGKIPVVVPRKKKFDEHINDHQVSFCNQVANRQGNIIVVENIDTLADILANYEKIVKNMVGRLPNNNQRFCTEFEKIVNKLMK